MKNKILSGWEKNVGTTFYLRHPGLPNCGMENVGRRGKFPVYPD